MKVILIVSTFPDLASEFQKVRLSLGVLSSDVEYYLDLIEMHLIEKEWVGEFCCVLDESAAFAVFHQMTDADAWIGNYRSERTVGLNFSQLTKLIQKFSTFFT